MEPVSVSKGVFARKAYVFGQKKIRNENKYCDKPWYKAHKQIYETITNSIEILNDTMYKQILQDLYSYVESVSKGSIKVLSSEIPTAILLAGINVPDHIMLFDKVKSTIKHITPYIATISSKNCNSMKSMVEESIYQLMNALSKDEPIIKKANCTFRALNSWYQIKHSDNPTLVIIIKDFENFNAEDLHDFVYNLSKYSAMKIVLIFGIATSLHIVHRTLSYDVTSKLGVKVFSAQTQLASLSDTLEGIAFSHDIPFKLMGKAFNFLQDVFLFYDLSVDGFLQGYKICLATHFFNNNCSSLCCDERDVKKRLQSLTANEIQDFRHLSSIAHYFQGKKELDDKDFKLFLEKCVKNFQKYMHEFLAVLKCLHAFARSCPSFPLGKLFREIYGKALGSNLTESDDYMKVTQYLLHLPKEEFLSKLDEVMNVADDNEKFLPENFMKNLIRHFQILKEASEVQFSPVKNEMEESPKSDIKYTKRTAFRDSLRNNAYKQTSSPYKRARENFVEYLDKEFSKYLKIPTNILGYEIFCFHDSSLVRRQIKGSLRAAVEHPLKNPASCLQCPCCKIKDESEILETMPDISIIYKLHLEHKKLINMHDWLQSFLTYIDPEQDDEQQEIDPIINSRFSQSVADLQILGYIKETKRKVDHVKRLV